ncbi:hypothetical protein ACPW7J_13990 [Ihubacter sp. rT4E-8]|uniref:hypothetical protein n=1 Tax=Ihubacter sp. rT4E-8 TaxID=3242369 RepID=UPI003CF3E746
MDWVEFCQKISEILKPWKRKLLFGYDDNKIIYTIAAQEYQYTIEDFNQLKQNAEHYDFKRYSICDGNTYESIVDLPDIDSRRLFSMGFEDKLSELTVRDEDANISYSFCEVSEELIWYIVKDYDITKRVFMRFPSSVFDRKCETLSKKDLFSLIQMITRLPLAVYIESNSAKSREQLQRYAKSFLFNIAYNFDFVFKAVTEIDDLFPQRTPLNKRRIHNVAELMAPQLSYKEELVEQYYMALASEDPFVKFIGFYHIMEHFYEEVYNEDIFKSVQYIIQHPGFSSKRTKDIVKIVDLIKKKTRQSKEEFQGSELEALELTLKKFVDISELINDLTEFNSSIVDYYKTSEVSFSKGDTIDLRDISNEKLYKKLSARIYKTRNALVHSKSNEGRANERGIYKPFDNSQELLMEIPLMRYISEAIIINSASTL